MATLPELLDAVGAHLAAVPGIGRYFQDPPEQITADDTPAMVLYAANVATSIGPVGREGPIVVMVVTLRIQMFLARFNLAHDIREAMALTPGLHAALFAGYHPGRFGGVVESLGPSAPQLRMAFDDGDWMDGLLRLNHDFDVRISHPIARLAS